ncbi:hypothetical protein [Sphingomonas phage Carli]|nr:hypothetical protein [Sphingomonas phage Carli]
MTHLEAIKSGTVTKTNVIGIRKAINHVERITRGYSGNRSNATVADVTAIERALADCEPVVSGELHDSGLKLLRSKRYAKRLEPVADIVANLESFRLVAYDRIGDSGLHSVPVYRATGAGRSFLFRNVAWQSGGNGPEIVRLPR